jgi:enoyl-CoA hydratase/carnithine racemase
MPELETAVNGPVLTVTFNRPDQHNAMTWKMYDGLAAACDLADDTLDVRVMVLRGAGGRAFVAGTDITQFAGFETGQDGVAYEKRVGAIIERLASVRVPAVAAIDGYCVGGGLAIACACDLRIATPGSRFGIPIARTLGNCLSTAALSLLTHHIGTARTADLLLNARLLPAPEAQAIGLISEVTDDLDSAVQTTIDRLTSHAPLTMWATKEAIRRLRAAALPDCEDIISRVYGSQDFHNAVAAFSEKRAAQWTGNLR